MSKRMNAKLSPFLKTLNAECRLRTFVANTALAIQHFIKGVKNTVVGKFLMFSASKSLRKKS